VKCSKLAMNFRESIDQAELKFAPGSVSPDRPHFLERRSHAERLHVNDAAFFLAADVDAEVVLPVRAPQ
jgi:hypothetical protein